MPKLAFMLPENAGYVGEWGVVDIGIDEKFISQQESDHFVITRSWLQQNLKARKKYDHKGTYGRALIISGSHGKMGAAVLCARAAMKSGLGLLTMNVPSCGYNIIQTTVPEAVVVTDPQQKNLSEAPSLDSYNAIGIGPGIGKDTATIDLLRDVLANAKDPMVIDADGLNILSENRELLGSVPAYSILTPHPTEFKRLAGDWTNDFQRLELQKQFSKDYNVIVIVKGAHTSISAPSGRVYFNMTGNPGMATAGSGDALTGIITSLLAQGYSPEVSSSMGVYIHGLAGDLGTKDLGEISVTASDIIEYLPYAFKSIIE